MNRHDAAQAPIVIFGEALVDDFITEQVVGGAPFNVARNLAAFGNAPRMITRIGQDKAATLVREQFQRFGLCEAGLQADPDEATGRVVVERGAGEHRFIILPGQAYDQIDPAAALAAADCAPATIYFGTLAQRSSRSREALRAVLAASGATRYLDLNVRSGQVSERCVFESLHEADIVKVNEEELQDLFSWYTHTRHDTADMASSAVRTACAALMRIFSLQGLIVTLGARGSVYFDAGGGAIESASNSASAAAPPRIVDTVGAGDAFSAIFLLGRERGWDLHLTLARANEFAAAICTIAGAVPADPVFYAPYRARWLSD